MLRQHEILLPRPEGKVGRLRGQSDRLRSKVGLMQIIFGLTRGVDGVNAEVTLVQLNTAIGGTAHHPSGVAALGLTISDLPTQAELQLAARRWISRWALRRP
jgi:hypothetical protein